MVVAPLEPAVLWFTGLSGSGKSTLANEVAVRLRSEGHRVEQLDGDRLRAIFPSMGFTRAERDANVRRAGYLASHLEQSGATVTAALISPYREAREYVRRLCRNFIEIHVATPLAVCEQRDVKGLYARARRGEIAQFTGLDDPYEPPDNPELTIDTSALTVEEASRIVLATVNAHFLRV
jgi:adenylylsulfate kinase